MPGALVVDIERDPRQNDTSCRYELQIRAADTSCRYELTRVGAAAYRSSEPSPPLLADVTRRETEATCCAEGEQTMTTDKPRILVLLSGPGGQVRAERIDHELPARVGAGPHTGSPATPGSYPTVLVDRPSP
jgi:hypothetical protein